MVRCQRICCCVSARTGSALAGCLAVFSSFYYLFIASMGFTNSYVTVFLVNIGSLLIGTLSLFSGIIMLLAYVTQSMNLVVGFVAVYSLCAYFRGILVANAIIVLVRWTKFNWRHSYDYGVDDDDVNVATAPLSDEREDSRPDHTVYHNSQVACVCNLIFVSFFFIMDVWAIIAALVWGSQMRRVREKALAEQKAGGPIGFHPADDAAVFTTDAHRPSMGTVSTAYAGSVNNHNGIGNGNMGDRFKNASIASSMNKGGVDVAGSQQHLLSPKANDQGAYRNFAANQRNGSRMSLEMHEVDSKSPAGGHSGGSGAGGRMRVRKVGSQANLDVLPRVVEPGAGEQQEREEVGTANVAYAGSSRSISPSDADGDGKHHSSRHSKHSHSHHGSRHHGSGSEENGLVLRRNNGSTAQSNGEGVLN